MTEDRRSKLLARDKEMRQARDKMLRLVFKHLTAIGFTKAGEGHYFPTRTRESITSGFKSLRVGATYVSWRT